MGAKVDKNGLDNKFEVFTITDTTGKKQFEDIEQLAKQKDTEAKNK